MMVKIKKIIASMIQFLLALWLIDFAIQYEPWSGWMIVNCAAASLNVFIGIGNLRSWY